MPVNAPDDSGTRLLRKLFGPEPEEYVIVAWSFAYFFCVLASYYILRPVREMIAVGGGPNTIPWLFFGTFVAMLVATPIFGWVTSRFSRRQFLPWVYLFFVTNIILFWIVFSVAIDDDTSHIWLGRVFFVWISIFNLFVVSVFWSFMADIYTREQGRRLFGFITAAGSIGGLFGGFATKTLVVEIGYASLFPIAAIMLLIAVFCIGRLRAFIDRDSTGVVVQHAVSEKPLGGNPFAGITHVVRSKYFLGITFASVMASLLGTALYIFLAQLVEVRISDPDEQVAFFAAINNWTNFLALVGQLFIVKHVVERYNIGISLTFLPIASIAGFALLAIEPTLAVAALITVLRRALGFGFSKPTTDMLYSVVTPEEKYKAKNFIDTTIYRAGDVVGSLAIRSLIALSMGIAAISVVMIPFAAAWGVVSYWLGQDYRRQAKQLKESGVA